MARPSLRGAPEWRRLIAAMAKRERDESYGYKQTLRYDIDVTPGAYGGPFAVCVRRQTGDHVADAHIPRPISGGYGVEPEDVAILTLLDGGNPVHVAPGQARPNPTRFHVPTALATEVLWNLAQTGRAHLAVSGGATDLTAPPVAWDDGPPFALALDVATDEAEPGRLTVDARLERGGVVTAIEAPLLLLRGYALFRDRVARYDDAGQPEWAEYVRREGLLFVLAEADLPLFLEELHTLARAPRVELPKERTFARVKLAPRPYVVMHTRATRGVSVELGLDYEGFRVLPYEPGHAVIDRAGRRIIDRDAAAEQAAVDRVVALGGTPVSGRFRIAKRDLLTTARALMEARWRVEIDGLGVTMAVDWLDVLVTADFDGARLTLPEMLGAIRQHRRTVVLTDGSIGEIPEEWVDRLTRWSALAEPTSETLRFRRAQAGLVDALAAGDAADATGALTTDATFEKARAELRAFDGVAPVEPAASFHGSLRDYQKRALGWFAYLQRFGFGGCLADDMGLGKTVQVLAMLDARRSAAAGPSLVVCPRSVLYNWASEAARFAPELRVHVHDGASRDAERFADHDVILTTYGLLRRDSAELSRTRFDYVVLDEAQAIKTAGSAASKAARALVCTHKVALTGTPIENHLGELASLLDFLNPGVLGSSTSLSGLSKTARGLDDDTRFLLARGIRPFFLRRTKQEVAPELPARVEQTIYCELAPEHRREYDELRDHYRRSIATRIDRDGWGKSAVHVLEALLRLRQLACHPGLIARHRRGTPSAKLDALLEHLAAARAEGHKALVFSQFTTLLGIVRDRLDEQHVRYEYLDGATKDRPARIARFQNDPECSVFLLSLKAGGVGLNLTAAEYVFLLDPWWNPASEAQAIDRAHRIGQTRTVIAYRLLARGTIEEKVEGLQKEKRALSDAFFGEKGAALGGLTREDLESLLG
jgi:superfamily II DNA or RNA helicase